MYHRIVPSFFLSVVVTLNAQTINLRGKISNQPGNAVANAVVMLQSQNIKDTTGADGVFSLTKSSVAVWPAAKPISERIILKHGVVEFHLPGPSPVKIELFDTKGALLKKVVSQDVLPGIYRFNLQESIQSANLLLIHASTGHSELSFRYVPLRDNHAVINYSKEQFLVTDHRLASVAAVNDTLKISANGYKDKVVKVTSYDTTIDVILDSSKQDVCIGCGKTNFPKSGKTTITVDGTQREYMLKMPDNYDPDKSYMLIFCPHWLSGKMDDVIGGQMCNGPYYGLEALSKGSAIFIAPQGMKEDTGPFKGMVGFANTNNRDIKFFRALVKHLDTTVCVDRKRIFSTGFSFGGMMSLAVGCSMNDIFRAIAPMSGAFVSGCDSTSKGPIAVWQAHGTSDEAVNISAGRTARDYFIRVNGCSKETNPVEPSPCVAYKGCKEGYPVIYCEFNGTHGVQNWAAAAVWKFFSEF